MQPIKQLSMTWHCFGVRQNQPWLAVAEFISRNECATTIQEALEVLKTWNPQWQPGFFMIMWLQWGRDRCHWNIIPRHSWIHLWLSQGTGLGKWVKDHITSSDADVLLDLLRACAWAPSTTPDEIATLWQHEEIPYLETEPSTTVVNRYGFL